MVRESRELSVEAVPPHETTARQFPPPLMEWQLPRNVQALKESREQMLLLVLHREAQ